MTRRPRWMRRGLALAVTAVAGLGATIESASASFPGRNGVIAYQSAGSAGTGAIATVDPVTGAVREVVAGGTAPAWSADGSRLAFVRGGIWVARADGSRQRRLTPEQSDSDPAWSPDGRRIVFARLGEPGRELWTTRSSGRRQKSLGVEGSEPAWSPDGRRIAYHHDGAVWTVAGDGTDRRLLASRRQFPDDAPGVTWSAEKPDWSPDGRQVVLQYTYDGPCEGCGRLARVPAGGGEPVAISGLDMGAPSWAPNGTEIAAHASDGLKTIVPTGLGVPRHVLSGTYFEFTFPAWQPLPARR